MSTRTTQSWSFTMGAFGWEVAGTVSGTPTVTAVVSLPVVA